MQQHIDELQERLAAEQTKSQLLAQALDEADGLEFIDNGDEHQNGDDNSEQATDDRDTNGVFNEQNTFYHSAINVTPQTDSMDMRWGSVDTRGESRSFGEVFDSLAKMSRPRLRPRQTR